MPSPFMGFTAPAASPTTSMPGTACGARFRLIGRGPESMRPSAVSSEIPRSSGSIVAKAANRRVAEMSLKFRNVLRRPAPRLTRPSAIGKSHP
jgi:hypothetical protein